MTNRVKKIDDLVKVETVLISVADKMNLEPLVLGILGINDHVRFYSTGGTHRRITEILGEEHAGNLTAVSEYTGRPEMQGGLVKTLDYKIYLGLLSETDNPDHADDLSRAGAVTFDLVVVNLYPFERTVAAPSATGEDARAHIDIGGPCMLRAAAKNFLRVAPLCDPTEYSEFLSAIAVQGGRTSFRQRFELARKAFDHTSHYDSAISEYLSALDPETVVGTYSARAR